MLGTKMGFSEEALNDLSDYFQGAPIGLHVTESDGTITRTNLAELELLGYSGRPDEYVGRHVAEFHADSEEVQQLLDRVSVNEPVAEHEATLLRRDGSPQKVLLYANARMEDGEFRGLRCFTFPHPEDLRPDIAEVGALRDESVESLGVDLREDERYKMYWELQDFFENAPVALHIVGGDGLIKRANKKELAAMGYDPEAYIGAHIAGFHSDQGVIDGMLTDLVGGTPLVNFSATLFHKNGSKLPVMIYSNSRMRDGSFVNTRCLTVPVPKSRKAVSNVMERFTWPRNEDLGFSIPGREVTQSKPNPMTLALKYIAARKRPEESLGFLARVSQTLASAGSFESMLRETARLCVPFLADFVTVDLASRHLAHASIESLHGRTESILRYLNSGGPEAEFGIASAVRGGETQACSNLNVCAGDRAQQLLNAGIRSLIMAPLTIRGQHIGALTLLRENIPSQRDFGPADRALAEEVARRISFAIQIDRLSARA